MDSTNVFSKRNEWYIHLFLWLLLVLFSLLDFSAERDQIIQFIKPHLFIITFFFVNVLVFYFHYLFILPITIRGFNWLKFSLGFLLSILLFIALRAFVEQYITFLLFHTINYYSGTGVTYYIFDNSIYGIRPVLIATMIWLIFHTVRTMQYNQILQAQSQIAEIKFLKAQINPHFIFNTLNNIYAMVYMKSENTLEAIEKLSNVMRFTTYESEKDYISIEEELTYINNYIDLERLRYDKGVFIDFESEVEDSKALIPPFSVSPLVENAFKHGDADIVDCPISFKLKTKDGFLCVTVKNKVSTHKKDNVGGVGLNNLEKRLEFYFKNDSSFSLIYGKQQDFFEVYLQIPLK